MRGKKNLGKPEAPGSKLKGKKKEDQTENSGKRKSVGVKKRKQTKEKREVTLPRRVLGKPHQLISTPPKKGKRRQA